MTLSPSSALLSGVVGLLGVSACAAPPAPHEAPAPSASTATPSVSTAAPSAAAPAPIQPIGKKVTLHGKAMDAKAGAIVLSDDDRPVYVEGLEAWPRELYGKKVAVTGVLTRKKAIPDPIDRNGAMMQGAWGEQTVLEGASWVAE